MFKRFLLFAWPALVFIAVMSIFFVEMGWGTLIILGAAVTAAAEFIPHYDKTDHRMVWSRRIALIGVAITLLANYGSNRAQERTQKRLALQIEEDLRLARENTSLAKALTERQEETLSNVTGGDSIFYVRYGDGIFDSGVEAMLSVQGAYPIPRVTYLGRILVLKDGTVGEHSEFYREAGPVSFTFTKPEGVEIPDEVDRVAITLLISQGRRTFVQYVLGRRDESDRFFFASRTVEIVKQDGVDMFRLRSEVSYSDSEQSWRDVTKEVKDWESNFDTFIAGLEGKRRGLSPVVGVESLLKGSENSKEVAEP